MLKNFQIFFEINQSRDILTFSGFTFRKIFLHNKNINKTRKAKNPENSAHCFGDSYLAIHLVKFLQDTIKPWGVGALRVNPSCPFL